MPTNRKKLLIVDGFNALRSGSRYAHLRDAEDYSSSVLNKAREALLNDVIAYMGHDYTDGIIVYDGGKNALSTGSDERIGAVRVIFTAAGVQADQVIEKLAREARGNGWEVMVVSSDAGVQDATFGGGVDRMSAEGFSREAESLEAAPLNAEGGLPKVAEKRTVEGRIDPTVAEKLKQLRDSL